MASKPIRTSRRWLGFVALAAAMLVSSSAQAGVVDGVQEADGLTIYLGVVPAAIAQGHPVGHPEAQMHGGAPGRSIHNMHLLVAVFNKATGARITNATVAAEIMEQGGRRWSVPLQPMTVNGALTFGGYTAFTSDADYMIAVRVDRPDVHRTQPVRAHFTWAHD